MKRSSPLSPPATTRDPGPLSASGRWFSRARLGVWIESAPVQRFVIAVIALNAVVLGLLTSEQVRSSAGTALMILDTVCLAVFVVEILIKLYAFRGGFFRSAWNVFDFLVIAVALIPGSGFAVLRALRVLRVLRLVSMVPALRRVVDALVQAIPGILSIGALLMLLFYVGAVMGTMIFGAGFPEYFGTLGRSLATLFQTMTMDNWSTIFREISQVQPWAWAFFVPFILLSAFTVLNLFVAVMVDAMRFLGADPAHTDTAGTSAEKAGETPEAPPPEAAQGEAPAEISQAELLTEIRALRAELAEFHQHQQAR